VHKSFVNAVVAQGVKHQDGSRENTSFGFGFIRITEVRLLTWMVEVPKNGT
jgi:hypothetical protein